MSFILPPTYSNIRKRKRSTRSVRSASVASAASVTSTRSHLPAGSIDPHSYGPAVRRQLVVAGLTHSDQLPGDYLPAFPHEALPERFGEDETATPEHAGAGGYTSDGLGGFTTDPDYDGGDASSGSDAYVSGTEADSAVDADEGDPVQAEARRQRKALQRETRRRRNALFEYRLYDQNVGVLAGIVKRGLQESEHGTSGTSGTSGSEEGSEGSEGSEGVGLARAKRAYGLLVRTEIRGKPVDLRRNHVWAMGAELLMREGETPDARGTRRRWGAAANVPRVRAFYEELIQQYPYNRLFPRSVSALTFWPALAGTELYSAHAELQMQGEQIERAAEAERTAEEDDDDKAIAQRRRARLEDARRDALRLMQDLARRMDTVLDTAPYSTNPEMLRLRGMVSLFLADLWVPTPPADAADAAEADEGQRARALERRRARARFAKLVGIDRDTQNGRFLGRVRHAGGLPDTVVDAYVRRMAQKAPGDSSGSSSDDGVGADSSADDLGFSDDEAPLQSFSSLPFRG